MNITNEEKIKNLNSDELAKFIMCAEMAQMVPKRYVCDKVNCFCCDKDLVCYREWLKQNCI